MKKIIIAILLVFSCGIFALTIPKAASAETVIYDKYFSTELSYYDGDVHAFTIDLYNTLLYDNQQTGQRLYLDSVELTFRCYIDYLFIDGQQMKDEYLYYSILDIHLDLRYIENGVPVDTFGLDLFTEQGEELTLNSGISVTDFEAATRDITNALIARTLSSTLYVSADVEGQLLYLTYNVYDIYPTGQTGEGTLYFYEWDPNGDNGIDISFPSTFNYTLGLNNIIPPNVQGYIMRYHILTYNREHGTTVVEPVYVTDGNFLDFIQDATTGFLETELFGTISIADILLFIVSIALLIFLLRFFAGG